MSPSPQKPNLNPPLNLWLNNNNKKKKALNHVLFTLHLHSLSTKQTPNPTTTILSPQPKKTLNFNPPQTLLSDEILLQILSKTPISQRNSNFLVSKQWLNIQGRLVRSLKLLDWNFLISGRLLFRFPNLVRVDLVNGCLISPRNSGVLLTQKVLSLHIDCNTNEVVPKGFVSDNKFMLPVDEIDLGLKVLANGCPNLRKLVVINASEMGLLSVAEECPTLQELELHKCNDHVLRGIAAFENLQILKLIGNVEGFYDSLVSDIGLIILAQGCKRLVKLEMSGCEGSYEGMKAIGQCCQMLEEMTLCDHRMEDGWLPALSCCENLKTLRFLSCKTIDRCPEPDEHLGFCRTLERLHLERCQLRDKRSVRALFFVCQNVRELVYKNCWGLDKEMFSVASICRRVKLVSLEGCSLLTTEGLESVILYWKELDSLRVISCKNIKDSEVTPALSTLFSVLKDLKWRPDTNSLLSASLAGTGMGKRGGRFFKKTQDWKSLLDV